MPKNSLYFIGLLLCLFLSACSTSSQATKCPTFSQKTSKNANKSTNKQAKKIAKLKPYLSEKYALNRTRKALITEENIFVKSQQIAPLATKKANKLAAITPNFEIENRTFVFEKPHFTKPEDKDIIVPKSIFSDKQKAKFERKLQKIKQKIEDKNNLSKEDRKANIGGILGIVSVPLLLIPVLNILSIPLAIIAVILTAKPSRRTVGPYAQRARTGFIMGVTLLATIVLTLIFVIMLALALSSGGYQ